MIVVQIKSNSWEQDTTTEGCVSESLGEVLHQPLLYIQIKEENTRGSNMKLESLFFFVFQQMFVTNLHLLFPKRAHSLQHHILTYFALNKQLPKRTESNYPLKVAIPKPMTVVTFTT